MNFYSLQKSAKVFLTISFLVLLSIFQVKSQTCSQIVGGTHFQALPGHENDYYYNFNLVKQIGPSGNILSSSATFANAVADFTTSQFVYSMTSNPRKLNNDYMDVNDTMLVVKMQTGTNSPLFSYKVLGLQAGSNYTVRFKVYHLPMYQSACQMTNQWVNSEIKIGVNPDASGNGMSIRQFGSQAAGWGQSYDYILTGTLAAGQTSVDLQIWTGYNFNACSAIGIGFVEVIGCLDAKIKSSQGSEVCRGEQTLLTLDKEYYATSYEWQKSINGGTTWTTIGLNKSVVDSVLGPTVYRAMIDGDQSRSFPVATITCCENEVGAPSSRTTVFFDDFGRFPTSNSYEDAFGNVTTGLTKAYRANVDYTLPGHTFDGTATIEDGNYGVTSYVPINVATWFNEVQDDHSQELNGGQLLINVAFNYVGPVYDRAIDGLCDGKELYFEAYIANASGTVNAPVITLNILSPDGLTVLGTGTATASAGEGWKRVSVPPFVLNGYTSVRIQILSRGGEGTSDDTYWRNGNDLLLDDIKFMVCSPPTLELVTNTSSFSKEETVCSDILDLTVLPSILLERYYGGSPKYLFQYSTDPTNISSWINAGIPALLEELAISDTKTSPFFSAVPNHGKLYFRVVTATDAIFSANSNFTSPNYADNFNYCKNYTISNDVEISMECPDVACTLPSNVTILSNDSDRTLCPGQSTTLTSNIQPNDISYDFTWYKGSVTPANIVKPTSTSNISFDTYDVTYAEAGTYYLVVRDKFSPTDQMCHKQQSIVIESESLPTYTLSGGGSKCSGSNAANVIVNFETGTPPYSITWSSPSTSVSNILTSSYTIPVTATGTYSITAISDAFCIGVPTAETQQIVEISLPIISFTYDSDDEMFFESEGVFRATDSIFTNMEINFTNTTFGAGSIESDYQFTWDIDINEIGEEYTTYNAVYSYSKPGEYIVSLSITDSNGCESVIYDTIVILENPNCKMKFPNSITPDLSTNNHFYPVYKNGISVDNYELVIYDRWGAKMWETNDLNAVWDGKFKGKYCKQDVYVYHCKAMCEQKDYKGKSKAYNLKGDVTVIR